MIMSIVNLATSQLPVAFLHFHWKCNFTGVVKKFFYFRQEMMHSPVGLKNESYPSVELHVNVNQRFLFPLKNNLAKTCKKKKSLAKMHNIQGVDQGVRCVSFKVHLSIFFSLFH